MIASTSAIHAHNLFGQKLSSRFTSSGFHSYPDLNTGLNRCFEIRAKEATKESSDQNDEDTNAAFYDDLYNKLESLNFLLNPPEETNFPLPAKSPQEVKNTNKSSFGVILDFEGVIVENAPPELNPYVWCVLSLEEEKTCPPYHKLQEMEGIKTEKIISEILNWSEDPKEIERIAKRKESIYRNTRRNCNSPYKLRDGTIDFISTLNNFNIPIALTSDLSVETLKEAVDSIGLKGCFDAMVSLDDVEDEWDLYEVAANSICIRQDRCVVFCSDEVAIEEARWTGMRSVAIMSRHTKYELCAADHVVKHLGHVSYRELELLACGPHIRDSHMEIVFEE